MLRGGTSYCAARPAPRTTTGRLVAVTAAGLLMVAGCGGSSSGDGSSAGSSEGSSASSSDAAGSSSSPATTAAKATVINVSVKDGKVIPKAHRVKVKADSSVRIMVTSDVDDEVHVHGYDIEREVSAGQPVSIEFTADQTGVFEVETHETGLLLLQLQVQ
jgi:heme/copper-type cytochrome/quinol oxidase subunit 2